jgi:hypothetical protein
VPASPGVGGTIANSSIYNDASGKTSIGVPTPSLSPIATLHVESTPNPVVAAIKQIGNPAVTGSTGILQVTFNGTTDPAGRVAISGNSSVTTADANGTGIYGEGARYGVLGVSQSSTGVFSTGLQGEGYNDNTASVGVFGAARTLSGSSPGTNYSIYGFIDPASTATVNYAGYFDGDVRMLNDLAIVGFISKGGGTFKIDDPIDPENKYLSHSFVESPDMMNIYNGNVTTDASGVAEITMPAYFTALNKDFRYQLTAIGSFAQAMVSKEISGNKFEIKTSAPNVKISWQVTGVRQDAYANAHRVVPEVEKEAKNKGKFLHARELGKSQDLQIFDGLPKSATASKNAPPSNNKATK